MHSQQQQHIWRNPSMPLVLALAEQPDRKKYQAAVRVAQAVESLYDPESQTSRLPAYAGTTGTVCYAGTGTVLWSDSSYPTDDE